MVKKISKKKILKGMVKSSKMNKTIVVLVQRYVLHPLYKKYIRKNKSYHVHDEKNMCKEGDNVKIISCRPFSKMKRFRLLNIIS